MTKRVIPREEILRRLNRTISESKPIIAAGCSAGLIAKCAEIGGADLIVAYSTGKTRLMGLPTTVIGDSNPTTLNMCDELQNVIKDTPIIAGVEGGDPRKLDLRELITPFIQTGYSGIINFPTIALYGESRIAAKESVGLGYTREVDMIKVANEMNIFTMAYVFSPIESKLMAEANVDCIVAHAGRTRGGLVGFKDFLGKEKAAKLVQEIIDAAKSVNLNVICLAHGGPFASPEDTRYLYEHTDSKGFVGASSIERIPIEKAVIEVVRGFKSILIKS
jgi:predicted TIM-barrel enzyme